MSRIRKRWLTAWGGAVLIAIANGGLREATYAERLGEDRANQISVVTGVSAFALPPGLRSDRRWSDD